MTNWATILQRAELVRPDHPAIVADGDTWTFADVARIVRTVSGALEPLGVGPGDRVVVVSRNLPEYLMLAGAVARLGAVLVPVNFRLSADEVAQLVVDCGARTLVVDGDALALGKRVSEHVPRIRTRIALEPGNCPRGWTPFEALVASEEDGAPLHHCPDTALARIMYTSGTTGRAKGVKITHGMWVFNSWAQQYALDLRSDDRILVTAPLHHVGGLDLPGLGAWLAGATLVVQRRFTPEGALALMRDEGVTGATLVQTMLHRLVAADQQALRGLSLRWLQFGSLPVSLVTALQQLLPGVALVRGYGMTETVGGFCYNEIAADSEDLVSVGYPLPFMEVRAVGEGGALCPPEIEGDIEVRGPKVTPGYFHNPEETSEAFRWGWLRTGDIGRVDESGRLTITDRRKDLIRSGSENISSKEIEELLYRHDSVREAAVVGLPDEQWGERPVAFVVTAREVPEMELTEHCRRHLARFKVPKQFVSLLELPRNASGKVAKTVLRDRLLGAQ